MGKYIIPGILIFFIVFIGGFFIWINVADQSGSTDVQRKSSQVSNLMDAPLEAGFNLVTDRDLVTGYKKTADEEIKEIKNVVESKNRDIQLAMERNQKALLDEMKNAFSDVQKMKSDVATLMTKQADMDKNVGRILQGQEAKVKVLENKMERTINGINDFLKNPKLIDSIRGQLERNDEQAVLEEKTQESAKKAVAAIVGTAVPVGVQETIENQSNRQQMLKNKIKEKNTVPQLQLDLGLENNGSSSTGIGATDPGTGLPTFEMPNGSSGFNPNVGFDNSGLSALSSVKYSPEGVVTMGSVDLSRGTGTRVTMTIPALSRVKAKIVHGVLAPADGNPAPMLFHVGDAWLGPMNSKVPLQGIMMLGMAKGVTNGSLASVELTMISGVTPNGEAFSLPCTGYVIGPKGKEGIEGILRDVPPGYWKKVTPLNFLSAGAAALAETTQQTQSDISGQQFSNTKPGKELSKAAYSALSATISDASNVFNNRLRDWKTAVEVAPLLDVTIVLVSEVPVEAMSVSMNSPGYGSKPKSYLR